MTTWWLGAAGDNGADGLSFANRKQSVPNIISGVSEGDIVNMANTDGPFPWPTTESDIPSGVSGTNWTNDVGLIIRGVDSSGNPAETIVSAAGANGVRRFVRLVAGTGHVLLRNLTFDATGKSADTNIYTVIRYNDNGSPDPGPGGLEAVAMLGADLGSAPATAGTRRLFDIQTGPSSAGLEILYSYGCYIQNAYTTFNSIGATSQKTIDHCVFYCDSTTAGTLLSQQLAAASSAGKLELLNCTIYESIDGTAFSAPIIYNVGGNGSVGTVNVYSNLVYLESSNGSPNVRFMGDAGAYGGETYTGTIDGNVLLGGDNVSPSDLHANDWYEGAWDANLDDSTAPDIQPNDTTGYNIAEASLFNDPSSTYDWDPLGNGATITLPKDLRLKLYTSAGLNGSLPGALPSPRTPTHRLLYENNIHRGSPSAVGLRTSATGVVVKGNSFYVSDGQEAGVVLDLSTFPANGGYGLVAGNHVSFHGEASGVAIEQGASTASGVTIAGNTLYSDGLVDHTGISVAGLKTIADANVLKGFSTSLDGFSGSNWGTENSNKTTNRKLT